MLLTILNLPLHTQYRDVKELVYSKCGLEDLIFDKLVREGNGMKVTVGVAGENEAALLLTYVHGLFYKGKQLSVMDNRQKKDSGKLLPTNLVQNQDFQYDSVQHTDFNAQLQMSSIAMLYPSASVQYNSAFGNQMTAPLLVPSPFQQTTQIDQPHKQNYQQNVKPWDANDSYSSFPSGKSSAQNRSDDRPISSIDKSSNYRGDARSYNQDNNSGNDRGNARGFNQGLSPGNDRGRPSDFSQGNFSGNERGNFREFDQGNFSGHKRGNARDIDQGNFSGHKRGNARDIDQGNFSGYDRGDARGFNQKGTFAEGGRDRGFGSARKFDDDNYSGDDRDNDRNFNQSNFSGYDRGNARGFDRGNESGRGDSRSYYNKDNVSGFDHGNVRDFDPGNVSGNSKRYDHSRQSLPPSRRPSRWEAAPNKQDVPTTYPGTASSGPQSYPNAPKPRPSFQPPNRFENPSKEGPNKRPWGSLNDDGPSTSQMRTQERGANHEMPPPKKMWKGTPKDPWGPKQMEKRAFNKCLIKGVNKIMMSVAPILGKFPSTPKFVVRHLWKREIMDRTLKMLNGRNNLSDKEVLNLYRTRFRENDDVQLYFDLELKVTNALSDGGDISQFLKSDSEYDEMNKYMTKRKVQQAKKREMKMKQGLLSVARQQPQQNKFESPLNKFQPPQNKFQPPQNKLQPQQNKLQPQQNKFQSAQKFQPPQNKFQPKQNQFQTPQIKFQPPQNKFQPPQNKFQPPQNKFQPPQNKFQPPQKLNPPQNKIIKSNAAPKPNQPQTLIPSHIKGDIKKHKQMKRECKLLRKTLEAYEMEPKIEKALDEELALLCQHMKTEFDNSQSEDDIAIYETVDVNQCIEEFKKFFKHQMSKRLTDKGMIVVRIHGQPKPPKRELLEKLLVKYQCISLSKSKRQNNMFIATLPSFTKADKLVALNRVEMTSNNGNPCTVEFKHMNSIPDKKKPNFGSFKSMRKRNIEKLIDRSNVNLLDKDWPEKLPPAQTQDVIVPQVLINFADGDTKTEVQIDDSIKVVCANPKLASAKAEGNEGKPVKTEDDNVVGDNTIKTELGMKEDDSVSELVKNDGTEHKNTNDHAKVVEEKKLSQQDCVAHADDHYDDWDETGEVWDGTGEKWESGGNHDESPNDNTAQINYDGDNTSDDEDEDDIDEGQVDADIDMGDIDEDDLEDY